MRRVLHLVTRTSDDWPLQFIELGKTIPDTEHEVVDLRSDKVDYLAVVHKIFNADSVQVW